MNVMIFVIVYWYNRIVYGFYINDYKICPQTFPSSDHDDRHVMLKLVVIVNESCHGMFIQYSHDICLYLNVIRYQPVTVTMVVFNVQNVVECLTPNYISLTLTNVICNDIISISSLITINGYFYYHSS
jgi:hypothetical protein